MKATVKFEPLVQRWGVKWEGHWIGWHTTPKEAKRRARQWFLYMTQHAETSYKYLTGEIPVK